MLKRRDPTSTEVTHVLTNYLTSTNQTIADTLGLTTETVIKIAHSHGLTKKVSVSEWTPEERQILREKFSGMSTRKLAAQLHRGVNTVKAEARALGLLFPPSNATVPGLCAHEDYEPIGLGQPCEGFSTRAERVELLARRAATSQELYHPQDGYDSVLFSDDVSDPK